MPYREFLAVRYAVDHVLFEFLGDRQPHHPVVHVLVVGFHVLVELCVMRTTTMKIQSDGFIIDVIRIDFFFFFRGGKGGLKSS